jgi:hypothetical protein
MSIIKMQLSLRRINLLFLAWTLLSVFAMKTAAQQGGTSVDSPSFRTQVAIDLCDAVRSPNNFHGRVVRLKALFFSNFENAGLLGYTCQQKKYSAWLNLNCGDDLDRCAEINRALQAIRPTTKTGGRTFRRVEILGTFQFSGVTGKRYGSNLRANYAIDLIQLQAN